MDNKKKVTKNTEIKSQSKTIKEDQEIRDIIYALAWESDIRFDPEKMYESVKGLSRVDLIKKIIQQQTELKSNKSTTEKLEEISTAIKERLISIESGKLYVDRANRKITDDINHCNTYIGELDRKFKEEQERLVEIELFGNEVLEFKNKIDSARVKLDPVLNLVDKLDTLTYSKLTINEINDYRTQIKELCNASDYAEYGHSCGFNEGYSEGYKDATDHIYSIIPKKVIKKYTGREHTK